MTNAYLPNHILRTTPNRFQTLPCPTCKKASKDNSFKLQNISQRYSSHYLLPNQKFQTQTWQAYNVNLKQILREEVNIHIPEQQKGGSLERSSADSFAFQRWWKPTMEALDFSFTHYFPFLLLRISQPCSQLSPFYSLNRQLSPFSPSPRSPLAFLFSVSLSPTLSFGLQQSLPQISYPTDFSSRP